MRLWSLLPGYLDTQGLLACWREGLLARKVLLGETRGYKNHPQLERFKTHPHPVNLLDAYLLEIYKEAVRRGFAFDRAKIGAGLSPGARILVTDGQLGFELTHLKGKLLRRDPVRYQELAGLFLPLPHPIFEVVQGEMEAWERNRP